MKSLDFFYTYAPITRITTIRILISIASIYNLVIYQMDVKTAILNRDLEEKINIKQPESFVLKGKKSTLTS